MIPPLAEEIIQCTLGPKWLRCFLVFTVSLRVVDVVVAVIAIIGVVSVFVYFCAVAISCPHVFNALPNVLACRINRVCPWNGPGQPGPVA